MRCAHPGRCIREICAHLELDRRRQDRLPDETRAVGQIGPPAFLMPFPARPAGPDTRAARPTDTPVGSDPRLSSFPAPPPPGAHRDHPPEPRTEEWIDRPASPADRFGADGPRDLRRARPPDGRRHQAVRDRPEEAAGPGDLRRVASPRARRHPRGPGRERLGQVDAHPPHQRTADPRRGSSRGLRTRHRPRRDGGQAPDQPGQRGRRLLQEAQPDGEPPLRGPSVRPRRQDGQARGGARSWHGWASRRSGSTGRSSR